MNKTPHPAKFSNKLLPILAKYAYGNILDPMAGTGKAGLLKEYNSKIKSVTINELEMEWAIQAKEHNADVIIIGDAKNLTGNYDCIVTSPPYGNRMADNFKASKPDSMRRRYVGDLGRQVSKESVCCKHFGKGYEEEIEIIFNCLFNNVDFNLFILNVSNFIRNFKEVDVVSWYKNFFSEKGFILLTEDFCHTPRQKGVGANTKLRVPYENILIFKNPKRKEKPMSMEKQLERIANALGELVCLLDDSVVTKVEPTPPPTKKKTTTKKKPNKEAEPAPKKPAEDEQEEDLFGTEEPPKEDPEVIVTEDQIRTAIRMCSKRFGREKAEKVAIKHGAKKEKPAISDIPKDNYPALMQDLEKLLNG